MEAGFVTVQEGELGAGSEVGEGGGDTRDFVAAGLLGEGVIEEAGFDGPGAAEAPVGGDHLLDDAEFDLISRFEPLDVMGGEVVEAGAGLVGEHEAF